MTIKAIRHYRELNCLLQSFYKPHPNLQWRYGYCIHNTWPGKNHEIWRWYEESDLCRYGIKIIGPIHDHDVVKLWMIIITKTAISRVEVTCTLNPRSIGLPAAAVLVESALCWEIYSFMTEFLLPVAYRIHFRCCAQSWRRPWRRLSKLQDVCCRWGTSTIMFVNVTTLDPCRCYRCCCCLSWLPVESGCSLFRKSNVCALELPPLSKPIQVWHTDMQHFVRNPSLKGVNIKAGPQSRH